MIPDGFVASYAGRQLKSMLDGLVPRSYEMHTRYNTSYPIYTGAGVPITVAMAIEAAEGALVRLCEDDTSPDACD